MILVLDKAP